MIIENTNTHVRYVQNTHTAHIINLSRHTANLFQSVRVETS